VRDLTLTPGREDLPDEGRASFGRVDQLDRDAIERLVASLTRLLGSEPAADGE
jgi:hypothetical protein